MDAEGIKCTVTVIPGGGYSQETSYYANSFGTATVILDEGRRKVGFHDYYNFDAKARSLRAQVKTAVGGIGYAYGGSDFTIDYKNGVCR